MCGWPASVHQDVRGLQIAVQDAPHVGVLHGLGRLDQEGHGGPRIVRERGEPLAEVGPLDQLHAEVALAVVVADLVNRDDAGMIQQCHSLGLVLEPTQLPLVGQHACLDHLERDGPVEAELPGLVDHAHAAPAKLFLNLVVTEVADGGAGLEVVGMAVLGALRIGRSFGR